MTRGIVRIAVATLLVAQSRGANAVGTAEMSWLTDQIAIVADPCDPSIALSLVGDFNGDGAVDVSDLVDYWNDWSAQHPDGEVTLDENGAPDAGSWAAAYAISALGCMPASAIVLEHDGIDDDDIGN